MKNTCHLLAKENPFLSKKGGEKFLTEGWLYVVVRRTTNPLINLSNLSLANLNWRRGGSQG